MIKPASAACNLACDYCFYLDTAAHRAVGTHPRMSDEVARTLIQKSLDESDTVTFGFQGGEPSLAGLPFFERFVQTVENLKRPETMVHYTFQTNGMKIDRQWTDFFKKHNFLVGLSFDGSVKIHDLHRHDHSGEGSGRTVANALTLLREEGVAFNVLTVVTGELANNVSQGWRYLTSRGVTYHQYIPCMDPLDGDRHFLTPRQYTEFLKESFSLWMHAFEQGRPISVRYFDNLVGMLLGLEPESCDMGGICSVSYVAEADGTIYPCDFFCFDDQQLGNIVTDSYREIDARRTELRFIEDSPNRIDECATCQWHPLCRGGCKRYRTEEGYRFCSSMKEFFPFAIEGLTQVARYVSRRDA